MAQTGRSDPSSRTAPTSKASKEDGAALLASFSKDWRRLRQQKQRQQGGVEPRMLTALSMFFGEHESVFNKSDMYLRGMQRDGGKNNLHLIFNLIKKQAKRRMGRIWKVAMEFEASPNKIDPRAFDNADVVTDLIKALDYRVREKSLHWQRIWWSVICGVCVEYTPWIENDVEEPIPAYDPETGDLLWKEAQSGKIVTQSMVERILAAPNTPYVPEQFELVEHMATVGDVGAQILSPFNFFIDASIPEIRLMEGDQACYTAEVKTVDWLCETFGNEYRDLIESEAGHDVSLIQSKLLDRGIPLSGMNLKDMLPAIQGSRAKDDPPICVVLTRFQPPCKKYPNGQRTILVPDQAILEHIPNPYGEIPLTDFHYEAPTTTFWTPDFIQDMIPAQKFLNKRMSQMGVAANATVHEILLLAPGVSEREIMSDAPGFVKNGITEDGRPKVQPIQRTQLPGWFLESIREVVNFINNVGGSDLTQLEKGTGQIRGPLALPMLQELLDSEDGPYFSHLGDQCAQVKQQRVNRVKQFYPPVRTLHFTGKSNRDEVLVFHTDDILKAGTDYTVRVDQASLYPEMAVIRRARVLEDLNGPAAILYTDPRTGKLDAGKIAIAMKYTDRGVEDRASQNRKMALHLIARLWKGQPLPPELPYPFWDHSAILDEMAAAMITTEWLEASEPVKNNFVAFYERCRQFLAAIQQSQMDSVQSQMMQGAVAQSTQIAAAKAASIATDTAVGQIQAQAHTAMAQPPGGPQMPDRPITPGPTMPQ